MKRSLLIVIGLIAISVFLLSAGSIITQPESRFPEKEISIALRNVGHRLLLHAGDSTSRVLPVKQLTEYNYLLEFQTPFAFVPDSLVNIVQQSLKATSLSLDYVVNVLACGSQEIVYGFQIGNQKQTTLVPCLGREQPEGCYVINLSFLQADSSQKKSYLFALALVSLVTIGFVGRAYPKNKNVILNQSSAALIGKFEFYADLRKLRLGKLSVDLSDKESQLLKLFVQQINQPVAREVLMKEVWQDNGALISRSLDVFVSRLRKKLKDDPTIQLQNVHGVGYKLVVAPS
ncbi:MAG TPA: winged helix-turn-helix domain-containing protein [Cyclobacteriaceae bacterium]|jgi:DNA-binding winged helix-turn-helix (wHTH) protein|nr:winged helix-turn-helix transcriptional regulator [Cytophagales bacterium]HRE65480.1 winged helix-turn-helix domain-containing protein [Cyclobacteriaceae bacterium]HRF32602.1 winged helix-turn-helix domain-containing protein [Cyclobacteriaceae bacterium]